MQAASSTGYEDLSTYIDKNGLEALNYNKSFPPQNALLTKDDSYLQSDSGDPQLLINIAFNQPVKIHHFVIQGGKDNDARPKTIKIFVNQIGMDFGRAEHDEPTQEFTLGEKDFGKNIDLRFVKFQHVKDLTVFVEDNHGGDATQISQLTFYGSSGQSTDMKNFKNTAEDDG